MAGARIVSTFQDQGFLDGLKRLLALGRNPRPLMRAIGVGMAENTRTRMDRGEDPDGNPWAPLQPAYAALKRGPGILREMGMRGGLQGSITFSADSSSVTVGTNKIYGAVHQFGATIQPKGGGRLVFRLAGANGRAGLVFAKQVKIPARPYLGFSKDDQVTVLDAVDVAFQRALQGR